MRLAYLLTGDVHLGGLHRARPGSMALVVKAGSRIRSVAGLKGRKIGVPHLRGLPALSAVAMLKRGGLDPDDVVLVESPYHHGVKAALLAEPYLTAGLREGRVPVLPPAGFEGLPTAGWMAADDWIKDNPRTLRAFQRALAKAHRLIAADPGQVVRVLPSYARVTSSDLDGVELGSYSADLDVPGLQRLADLARRHSVLREPLDVRDFVIK
ncbi:ABC transporter substrate-binding protein [Nonomuraea mesophila]|uniref:ABC transporter substrate-binding protein n=1 Tax=Nonomuraea mesophila TaxID=2530382 RepID=A0A4R5EVE1_9ACTN|nr:ABC transporter substrate-binding protein [Nonomuraea mesophila]TDE38833.1 ABC transporter substrate-binding protein [Nonomuraea mesophila]